MVSTQIVRPAASPASTPLLLKKKKLDPNGLQAIKIPGHDGKTYAFKSIQDGISLIKSLLEEGESGKLLLAYDTKDLGSTTNFSLIKKINGEIHQIDLKENIVIGLNEAYKDESYFLIVDSNGSLVVIAAGFFDEETCSRIMSEKAGFPVYESA